MSGTDDFLKQIADEREAYTTRIDAIEAVRSVREPAILEALLKALNASDAHVRRKAAEVLADHCAEAKVVQELIAAFQDTDDGVRRNVVRSLAPSRDAKAFDLVRKAASDPSPLVRRAAEDALKTMTPPSAEPPPMASKPLSSKTQEALQALRADVSPPDAAAPAPVRRRETEHPAPPPHGAPAQSPQPAPVPPSPTRVAPARPKEPAPAAPFAPTPTQEAGPPQPRRAPSRFRPDEALFRSWRAAASWPLVELAAGGLLIVYLLLAPLWALLQGSALLSAMGEPGTDSEKLTTVLRALSVGLFALVLAWLPISFIGLAIARFTAPRVAGGEPLSLTAACRFAVPRWPRAFLLPMPCLLLLAVLAALKILLMQGHLAGAYGPVLQSVLYLLQLALAAMAVVLAFLLLVAGPLWLPCLAVEDSSLQDTFSAALLFVMRAPWVCLGYGLATLLRAAAVGAFVAAIFYLAGSILNPTGLSALLTLQKLRVAWSQPFGPKFLGDFLIGMVQALALFLTGGYLLTLLSAGATGTFFTVRTRVSAAPQAAPKRK